MRTKTILDQQTGVVSEL